LKLNIRTHFVFGRVSLDFTFISKYPSHCSRQHVLQHGFTQWLPPPSFTFMAADIYSNICWKSYLSTLYHVIIYVSMIFFHLSVWYTRVRCRCIVCFFNYLLHNLSYCFKNIRQFILLFKNTWNKNKCWYKSVKLSVLPPPVLWYYKNKIRKLYFDSAHNKTVQHKLYVISMFVNVLDYTKLWLWCTCI
jgi:hypothetical protein